MSNLVLLDIYFLPPMAIARVGNSDVPLENYAWDEDSQIHGACRTIIRPRCTFRVRLNGGLEPYLPREIQFKDEGKIRPVAPFFELWADILSDSQDINQVPVDLLLL
ncbi:MAG: hypothetical protein QNJ53_29090 [Pleurocapsa sp. MO_192.B19]|nr:hypothetical protein [Pleurocapsa sp. MO_192.B19]